MDKQIKTHRDPINPEMMEMLQAGVERLKKNQDQQTKFVNGLLNYCMEQHHLGWSTTLYMDWNKTYNTFKKGNIYSNNIHQSLNPNPSLFLAH